MEGIAAISRFFTSEVSNATGSRQVFIERDGESTVSSEVSSETLVNTQTKLFAIHFAAPWFNKETGEWETIAYIDRDEAWEIFEPNLRQRADNFRNLCQIALSDNEVFNKILIYSSAMNSAEDLLIAFEFARTLHPLKAGAYKDIQTTLSKLPSEIAQLKLHSMIFIECPTDLEGTVYAAFSDILSKSGFPISNKQGNAAYIVTIGISENEQILQSGIFYSPTLEVTIAGTGGSVFSYGTTFQRIGASSAAVAKRRAYTAIADMVRNSFPIELEKGVRK
ncbi:hypothetical protein [Treponema primitia]|uniref:hypothetical protein n=1 Tax=Treponema primitia TaxID=88058 RepID=UPI0012FD0308|nr:hypothetical protein [Treponema primitia]